MECPACSKTLTALQAGSMTLDACTAGCGGVWFDEGELIKFDEQHEFPTHPILELAEKCKDTHIDHDERKKCPKCTDEPLVRQFFDVEHEIEIDQCWSCAGIWLDPGELNGVRAQFATYEDRASAVNLYVDTKLDDIQEALEKEVKAQVDRYNEQTESRMKSARFAFLKLLGVDDDPTDGL